MSLPQTQGLSIRTLTATVTRTSKVVNYQLEEHFGVYGEEWDVEMRMDTGNNPDKRIRC